MWYQKTYLETRLGDKMKTCLQKDSSIKVTFYSSWYVNREGKEDISWQFFLLIGLKLSGRNCETINCFFFFFYQCATVWRRFSGGLPLLPATIFPSAFHSFCLSHFSINLHNLTLFIESGWCLLHRTNKMLPFSLPHNNLLFFPFSPAIPLGGGISAQDAELHSALQGLAGMRLYVSD